MAEGKQYGGIVRRLKDTLRQLTMKLLALFLFVGAAVGLAVFYALKHYSPKFVLNDKGKPVIWKMGLIAGIAGLVAGGGAYFAGMI